MTTVGVLTSPVAESTVGPEWLTDQRQKTKNRQTRSWRWSLYVMRVTVVCSNQYHTILHQRLDQMGVHEHRLDTCFNGNNLGYRALRGRAENMRAVRRPHHDSLVRKNRQRQAKRSKIWRQDCLAAKRHWTKQGINYHK